MTASFKWEPYFNTGIELVDEQHQHLVDLINQFGDQVLEGDGDPDAIHELLQQLTDYTLYHFHEEEALMESVGLHEQFVSNHKRAHQSFIDQVQRMKQSEYEGQLGPNTQVLDFLCHWLVYHVLGQDQDMARQIRLVDEGVIPEEAYRLIGEARKNDHTEALLKALNNLFELLTDRNEELERKVLERTRELAMANQVLKKISLTDPLTDMPNRRYAMEQLAILWQESVALDSPLSCLMIDADYFKEVNDAWGHDAGDVVLKALARTLQHEVRTDDFAARLGGDEFFVICPGTGLAGAMQLADHLLGKVKAMDVRVGDGGQWKSSISIGVASRTVTMAEPNDLIKVADSGLYLSKRDGRGCARNTQS